MKQAAQVLGRNGWLSGTPDTFQRKLLSRCDPLHLRSGDPVYRSGEPAGGIFGVVSGRVELHLPHLRADKSLCHVAGAGYWFGDLAAISGQARRFEVRAREESHMVRLSRAEMMRLLEDFPEGWKYLAAMVTSNLGLALTYLEAMKAQDSTTRVKAVLQALVAQADGTSTTLEISQDDLAAIAGLSRKSINSAIKRLEATGEVTSLYRSIRVNGPA